MRNFFLVVLFVFFCLLCNAQVDSTGLDQMFGRKGTVTGNVYRVTFPRSDIKIAIGDFSVAPGLALTSWVALHRMGSESMMMGDLCMLDSEEPAVVAKLVE
ncbi:MAG TPA: DUF1259 domain-containing protein, partial [Puia sp.]|nr:DUF1259 domain-containing protein [Puia sp.]